MVLLSGMSVEGDPLDANKRADTVLSVARASPLILTSRFKMNSITILAAILTTLAGHSKNSSVSNIASVTLTRYHGDNTISSFHWWRRISKLTYLNCTDSVLPTVKLHRPNYATIAKAFSKVVVGGHHCCKCMLKEVWKVHNRVTFISGLDSSRDRHFRPMTVLDRTSI